MIAIPNAEMKIIMPRHGNRIHKRIDGRWEGRYKIGNNENGRTVYASVYANTFSEAKEKLRQAKTDFLSSNNIVPKGNILLFNDVVTQWYTLSDNKFKKSQPTNINFL